LVIVGKSSPDPALIPATCISRSLSVHLDDATRSVST
jgi:hypothetical protein